MTMLSPWRCQAGTPPSWAAISSSVSTFIPPAYHIGCRGAAPPAEQPGGRQPGRRRPGRPQVGWPPPATHGNAGGFSCPGSPPASHPGLGDFMTDAATGAASSSAATVGARRTPLTHVHERLGATLTDFAGWLMPLRYGSETAEHNAVRSAAGLFDLSHMGEILVTGPGAAAALDYALVGQPSTLAPGRARYTMICAPDGGILDDLIVYRLADAEFLVVANAANTDVVAKALTDRAGPGAQVADRTADYALIALQGPNATSILTPLTNADLGAVKYYASYPATVAGRDILLARTGYTGEDGFER